MEPLDPAKLVEHVGDATAFVLPFGKVIPLPSIGGFQITKFMVIELLAALLIVLIFVPIARKLASGSAPKGRYWNMFEAIVQFIRTGIVRPAMGGHDSDRFLPFILTLFFFILFCNVLGLVPCLGSPTASMAVTAPLAVITFAVGMGAGMKKNGVVHFWANMCPPMPLPLLMQLVFVPLIWVLEVGGTLIRYAVLAVRLLANMYGGHLVLAIILGFIPAMAGSMWWYGVTPIAVLGATAISLLELFFAFLQAYIFAFLASLFIGMAIHQH
jgi:F-type H+-transporting ATPase subunit a